MDVSTTIANLPHSTTNPRYLDSNSTSHVWVFGAIAELIDNSADAGASRLDIDHEVIAGKHALIFTDNGSGLDLEKLHLMLSFGHCGKKETDIGRYGNGFKSGSMRVGMDAMVFSRRDNLLTLGFLSQTFLYEINAPEVLVPIVSWDAKTKQLRSDSVVGHESHTSLETILQHSPYKEMDEIFRVFSSITSKHGTRIIIYNLKKQDHSEKYELDFSDVEDIRLRSKPTAANQKYPKEHFSLAAYCAILYLDPKMSIFIRGKRVNPSRISSTLLEPRRYTYASKLGGTIPMIFGFVPKEEDRNHYGVMMYYNNRLIKSYVHVGMQLVNTHSVGKAIVGVVQANWLQPTHNKQDFYLGENKLKQYELLMTALGEKLKQYWNSIGITQKGIGAFTKALWAKKPAKATNRKASPQKATRKVETTRKATQKAPAGRVASKVASKKAVARQQEESEESEDSEDEESEEEESSSSQSSEDDDDEEFDEDTPLNLLHTKSPISPKTPRPQQQQLPSTPTPIPTPIPTPTPTPTAVATPPPIPTPTSPVSSSLFPRSCGVRPPIHIQTPKIEPRPVEENNERKIPVTCTLCFKWRLVPQSIADDIPDDWTCMRNPDKSHNSCDIPQEDPEGEIPKAAKPKEPLPSSQPIEQRVTELRTEITKSRDSFARKDRIRERQLIELEGKASGTFSANTLLGEGVIGKDIGVYWRVLDKWLPAKIKGYNAKKGTHRVVYKDGEEEYLRLEDEEIYFEDSNILKNSKIHKLTLTSSGNPPILRRQPINGKLPNGVVVSKVAKCESCIRNKGGEPQNGTLQKIPKAKKSTGVQTDPIKADTPRNPSTPSKQTGYDKDRDRDRRDRDRKRDRSRTPERSGYKRNRSKSPTSPRVNEKHAEEVSALKNSNASVMAELDSLRKSVRKFLQLQYPINSAESEATEDKVYEYFSGHVKKMETEEEISFN